MPCFLGKGRGGAEIDPSLNQPIIRQFLGNGEDLSMGQELGIIKAI